MKLIVPTDFSKASLTAFKFAVELAEKAAADIKVIHIIHLPLLSETTFGIQPPRTNPGLIQALEARADLQFDKMRDKCPANIKISFSTIPDAIVPGILSYVEKVQADLLILTPNSQEHGTPIFGTTAQRLVRRSSIPVLSIPHKCTVSSIKSIVLASDLPLNQKHFMNQVKKIQRIFEARLHVLFVNSPLLFLSSDESKKRLEKFEDYYQLTDHTLNVRNNTSEIEGIRSFMKEVNGDLLLAGTHGRTGLSRFLNGSVAESSLADLDFPIWISKAS